MKLKLEHPPPPQAYPGHLMPLPAREGGHLITTHRGGEFDRSTLDFMLRVTLIHAQLQKQNRSLEKVKTVIWSFSWEWGI